MHETGILEAQRVYQRQAHERHAAIRDFILEHHVSRTAAAREFEVSRATVIVACRGWGIPHYDCTHIGPMPDYRESARAASRPINAARFLDRAIQAQDLRRQGFNVSEISRMVGACRTTVLKRLNTTVPQLVIIPITT